jgi:uncharacterized protein with ParB-like and HNH nuclease domain/predicted transport protein
MQAAVIRITQLLNGTIQFNVPVYQRDYSWGTQQCDKLLDDIISIAQRPEDAPYFLGSFVYIVTPNAQAGTPKFILIDGQQRLTTLTILIISLRNRLIEIGDEEGINMARRLQGELLINEHRNGDDRYKVILRRNDREFLIRLVNSENNADGEVSRIQENYSYFSELLRRDDVDIDSICRGIGRLAVVHISLSVTEDDPQGIFESLNSTGVDLSQSDLIRNYVLMCLGDEAQTMLYVNYWEPIERCFGQRQKTEFDKFVRDYLTLQLGLSRAIKPDHIYSSFRIFLQNEKKIKELKDILEDLLKNARFYEKFNFNKEKNSALGAALLRLRRLTEVASPIIMVLYGCLDSNKITREGFIEAVTLLESYVIRRAVCDLPSKSLGQIFVSLAKKIDEENALESIKIFLYRLGGRRRYPSKIEFIEALQSRDVYDMRICRYLLERLANRGNEEVVMSENISIEHVLPQNKELNADWINMLGENYREVQERYIHRLGNLTLTGYNASYSDRSFDEKKNRSHGFLESQISLNVWIRNQDKWDADTITCRGRMLADMAANIWPDLVVDAQAVRNAENQEMMARAGDINSVIANEIASGFLNSISPRIRDIGADVIELPSQRSVVYRVNDYFVELIPRARGLSILINMDFEDCIDGTGTARDASEYAWIPGASEQGGVLFTINREEDIDSALFLIKQAYERVTE